MGDFERLKLRALAEERPCLALVPAIHRSATYLGGLPDLPREFAWPVLNDAPVPFLGQIDLSAVPKEHWPAWMPREGRLLFFHDADRWGFDPNERAWSVQYVEKDSMTFARVPPSSLSSRGRYKRKDVELAAARSFPSYERLKGETENPAGDDFNKTLDFYAAFDNQHQLFGWPQPTQSDDMEVECELASRGAYEYDQPRDQTTLARANDWQLLLQLGSDDDVGMMWGDGGTLYFFVRVQDAMRGDFSNVWMARQ